MAGTDPYALPDDLPVPEDDGACEHLSGRPLPALSLPATTGEPMELAELGGEGTAVLFIYPRTGRPGEELPTGWDLIPGARGCTPQSCAFRDLHAEFAERGVPVVGLSAQPPEDQAEFAERVHLQFPLLSDPSLELAAALDLPTFSVDDLSLYKRVTLVIRNREIVRAFYPVFPPDRNAADVLAWLSQRPGESDFSGLSGHPGALVWAEGQVAAVRDDPAARLALMSRVFRGPTGSAPRHLPFRRAALSFMRWQARRGVLNPLDASPPGSVWWRAINERLLRDGCETVALLGGLAGEPSSRAVRLWLEFAARPMGRNWYRAHNASIVGGYLEQRGLAEAESSPERFFMNVALVRVLYAHALVAAPRLALGRLAPLGRLLGDPRLGMAGAFLSLGRVLPHRYPLDRHVERYIAQEQRLGRMLDYAVIAPRLQRLYEWSAVELAEPRLLELIRDGSPIYAWPFAERRVWRSPHMPFPARALARVTRPSTTL